MLRALFRSAEPGRRGIRRRAQVRRLSAGNIPVWVAWDRQNGGFILGEAKGVMSGPENTPKCVENGKAQSERVEVLDQTFSRNLAPRGK